MSTNAMTARPPVKFSTLRSSWRDVCVSSTYKDLAPMPNFESERLTTARLQPRRSVVRIYDSEERELETGSVRKEMQRLREMGYLEVSNMPGRLKEILHYGRHFDLRVHDSRIQRYVADLYELMVRDDGNDAAMTISANLGRI